MKKILPILVSLYLAFVLLAPTAYGASSLRGALGSKVQAQVGEFYLNLSGFMSPYASIILTIDGVFIRATVADGNGDFYISQVLIKSGFDKFCLDAIDFKRIGESLTCINVPPAHGSITKKNIFLPPTLGLSKTSVFAGQKVLAFGYTMPNAYVTLNLGNGKTETVLADSTGYYVFTLSNLPPGTYNLFATAHYKNLESLSPTKKVQLKSLSWWDEFLQFLRDLWARIIAFLTSISLGPLWLGLPILIFIIILILRLWPERFTFIYENKLIIFFSEKKPKKHLHHYWMVGF